MYVSMWCKNGEQVNLSGRGLFIGIAGESYSTQEADVYTPLTHCLIYGGFDLTFLHLRLACSTALGTTKTTVKTYYRCMDL